MVKLKTSSILRYYREKERMKLEKKKTETRNYRGKRRRKQSSAHENSGESSNDNSSDNSDDANQDESAYRHQMASSKVV